MTFKDFIDNSNDKSATPESNVPFTGKVEPVGDPATMVPFLEHVAPELEMHSSIYPQVKAELDAFKNKK